MTEDDLKAIEARALSQYTDTYKCRLPIERAGYDVIALVAEVRRLRSRVNFHEGLNLIKNAEAMGLSKDLMMAYAVNECGTVVADADRPLFLCKRTYNHDGPCSPRKD